MPHIEPDPQMVEMLCGMNASADLAVVQRTRRAVLQAATELREQRSRNRRNTAIAALTVAVLVMVLTPAIWSTMDDFLGGSDFFEAHSMMTMLVFMLFSTILGALLIGLRNHRQMSHGRR
jgi:cytochrome bd-type quinol oxidase subunit 2